MPSILLLVLLLSTTTVLFAQPQQKTVVYSEYFTSYALDSVAPQLIVQNGTSRPASIEQAPRGMKVLGRLGPNDSVHVILKDLPRHSSVKLSVGFHVIGSWDGEHDDDRVSMIVDGKSLFSETFSNTVYPQSFPALTKGRAYPARTGARNSNMLAYKFIEPGVYDGPMDATYLEDIEVKHTGSSLDLVITASMTDVRKGLDNESWALEHVSVTLLGEAPTADMWPHIQSEQPHRVWDHEEIVDFEGPDVRVVAGYQQNADLPGLLPGSDWESEAHALLLSTKCMSCGMFCMMYTIRVYSDNWVNIWSNREPYGPATISLELTPEERDSIRNGVIACLGRADMASEYEAEDIFENPDQSHCEFLFSAYGKDKEVHIYGGEPPEITHTLDMVMRILKRRDWEPTPFSEEGESGH